MSTSPSPNPTTTHLPQENRACFTCWRPHPPPISRFNVLSHTANPHPKRTSDLVRSRQATDSSTRSRAADLRPRAGPKRPRAAAREVVLRSVSRRGRRRSQGAMTDLSWFEPFSPHQQAKCPLALRVPHNHPSPARESSLLYLLATRPGRSGDHTLPPSAGSTSSATPPIPTQSGPPTSHGAPGLRAAARHRVLRTSDLA
jgi:hypothetical protein